MTFWPFRKRKPEPKAPPRDGRDWNESWAIGDTAEVILAQTEWHCRVKPWEVPPKGSQFIVAGFSEDEDRGGVLRYFLDLKGWPHPLPTQALRKVRPVATEKSEIVERILNAKPGVDQPREEA